MDELIMAIGLCLRHQNQNKKKPLWNYLLDSCSISQQKINNCIKTPSYRHKYPSSEIRYLMKQTVNDIVSKTLTAMMRKRIEKQAQHDFEVAMQLQRQLERAHK
eukprot:UN06103